MIRRSGTVKIFSPWPYAIIASFLALACFDAGIVVLAMRSQVANIEESPYEAGLQYERVLEAKSAALRDGVNAHLIPNDNEIELVVEGLPGQAYTATINFLRPNDPTQDRAITIGGSDPQHTLPRGALTKGLWLVQLSIESSGRRYYFEQRFVAGSGS